MAVIGILDSSLERSDSDERELGKSDCCSGERSSCRLGWVGNPSAATINIVIPTAERRRAPVFRKAAFYHRGNSANAAVSYQVHRVLNSALAVFATISGISC